MNRLLFVALLAAAQDPVRLPELTAKEFEATHKMISPLPGEYAWRDEIPWLTRLGEAREKAAAEDKPIIILGSQNAYALGRT